MRRSKCIRDSTCLTTNCRRAAWKCSSAAREIAASGVLSALAACNACHGCDRVRLRDAVDVRDPAPWQDVRLPDAGVRLLRGAARTRASTSISCRATADLSAYKLVVVPSLAVIDETLVQQIESSSAQWVFGPRSGSKTNGFAIPGNLPPGALQRVLPMQVLEVESLAAVAATRHHALRYTWHCDALARASARQWRDAGRSAFRRQLAGRGQA